MRDLDPWHDYLALPVAPFLLLVQLAALFLRRRLTRWGISIACTAAIATMFLYVDSLPLEPDEGVNIGAGVLLLWLVASVLLLVAGILREVVALAMGRMRLANRNANPPSEDAAGSRSSRGRG
jgi:hypothetical protein